MNSSCQIDAEIVKKEQISADIFRLTIQADGITERAQPGQFIMVKASEQFNGPPFLRRPFSIHQATANGRLQILFKKVGKGTEYLASQDQGDILSLIGPLGKGFLFRPLPTRVCLIGGGMGIAPLFFLAKECVRDLQPGFTLKVLLGAATAGELTVLQRDFESLGVAAEIATDDGSLGHHGLVTDLLQELPGQGEPWQVFSCGPHPMLKAVASICDGQAWPCQVSLETLMACGISACLGCAVSGKGKENDDEKPYLHVCKDGPVFQAGEIEWI